MTPNITETGIGRGLEVHVVIEAEAGPATEGVFTPRESRVQIVCRGHRHPRVLSLITGQKSLPVSVILLRDLFCHVAPLVLIPEPKTTKAYIPQGSRL